MKTLDNMVYCILVLSKICLCVGLGTTELLYEEGKVEDGKKIRTVRKFNKCRFKK